MATSTLEHTFLMGNSVPTWLVKNTTHTAAANEAILADTSSAPWTLTLPASPAVGTTVTVVDYKGYFATNNLTLGRNSVNINGAAADFACTETNASYTWIYTGATLGWRIFSITVGRKYPYPRGYIDGLNMSNNSTDGIDVAVGSCRCSANLCNMDLKTAFTNKVLANTWAAGSGSNGLDTGTVAVSTFYYVWLIEKDSDGTYDVLFSLSATTPTKPTGYVAARMIGAVYRNASGDIEPFLQVGDSMHMKTPRTIVVGTTGTTATTTVVGTPTAYRTRGLLGYNSTNGHSNHRQAYSPALSASTMLDLTAHGSTGSVSSTQGYLICDAQGRLNHKSNSSPTTVRWTLFGWVEDRGSR